MQARFLIAVIFIFLIGWFAIQNIAEEASLRLLFGEPLKIPSIVVIAASFLMGVVFTVAFGIIDRRRLRRVLNEREKELEEMRKGYSRIENSKQEEEGPDELSQ